MNVHDVRSRLLVWLLRIVGQPSVSLVASWNSRWANPDMLRTWHDVHF